MAIPAHFCTHFPPLMNFQGFAAYKMAVAEQNSLLQFVDYLINSPDCV